MPQKLAKANFGIFPPLKTDLSLHELLAGSGPTLLPPPDP